MHIQKTTWRIVATGIVALVVLVAADEWSGHKLMIWLLGAIAAAVVLFVELRKPVNYKSLSITRSRIEYVDLSNRVHLILFREIAKIEFVREEAIFPCIDGPYLETKWIVQTAGGSCVELMDELPHRRKLLRAFRIRLAGFSSATASAALGPHMEGRWLCFQARSAGQV